jgi:CheY-like chemotaxis protein
MTNFSYTNSVGSPSTTLARSSLFDGARVLIIEDHEDIRFLLLTILEKRGIRVFEAEDGKAGVLAAEELHPDLILMD